MNPHREGRSIYRGFVYRGVIALGVGVGSTTFLHSTKDTQSKGVELHEPRTTEHEEYEDYIVGYVCFIDRLWAFNNSRLTRRFDHTMQEPLNDSLGLNSTGEIQEQSTKSTKTAS